MTEDHSRPQRPLIALARRVPATLTMVLLILVVGIIWGGLWSPFEDTALFKTVAYGLPNLVSTASGGRPSPARSS